MDSPDHPTVGRWSRKFQKHANVLVPASQKYSPSMNEGAVRESVAGGLHGAGADITVNVMLRIAKGCGECPDVLAMTGAISHTHSIHIDIV